MLIDSHAHIYSEYYDDIKSILVDTKEQGIYYIISSGVDMESNKELLNLSSKYNELYITLGIHPENSNQYIESDITFIENNLQNDKVIAIGEIGLDYHYEGYDQNQQIELFEKQLSMAEKYNIPVVIHSREATLDTISILKKYNVKGVIHSFSGSLETAKEYIKMGFVLAINGVVTFKSAKIKDVIKDLGIEYFVLETDSPYLTPEPLRGLQNKPGNVKYIAKFLADYLGLTENEVAKVTSNNVCKIFDKFKI